MTDRQSRHGWQHCAAVILILLCTTAATAQTPLTQRLYPSYIRDLLAQIADPGKFRTLTVIHDFAQQYATLEDMGSALSRKRQQHNERNWLQQLVIGDSHLTADEAAFEQTQKALIEEKIPAFINQLEPYELVVLHDIMAAQPAGMWRADYNTSLVDVRLREAVSWKLGKGTTFSGEDFNDVAMRLARMRTRLANALGSADAAQESWKTWAAWGEHHNRNQDEQDWIDGCTAHFDSTMQALWHESERLLADSSLTPEQRREVEALSTIIAAIPEYPDAMRELPPLDET